MTALTKCPDCGREVSKLAVSCPGCGRPFVQTQPANDLKRKNTGCLTLIGVFFVGLVAIKACKPTVEAPSVPLENQQVGEMKPAYVPTPEEKKVDAVRMMDNSNAQPSARLDSANLLIKEFPGTPEATRAAAILPELESATAEQKREQSSEWTYSAEKEEMGNGTIYEASVASSNTFQFDFPYQGEQRAMLTIRKHPKWGRDAILSIEKGQITCSVYDCPISVRIDDAKAINVRGTEPSDNSSETVFIPLYDTLVKKLPGAKTVKIQFTVFHQGTHVAEFNVGGFNPKRMTAEN